MRPRQPDVGAAARHFGTVLVAVALTAFAAVVAGCATSAPPTSSTAQFVGFRWRIVEVRHGGSDVTIPAALRGFVAFGRDRTLRADDSVNAYFGRYRLEHGDSYRPRNVGTTLVGWVGHDPVRSALISAVGALTRSGADVTAELHGGRLRLSTGGFVITCSRAGRAPDEPPPSPTPARS